MAKFKPSEFCLPSAMCGIIGRQSQAVGNPIRHCGADEIGQYLLLAG